MLEWSQKMYGIFLKKKKDRKKKEETTGHVKGVNQQHISITINVSGGPNIWFTFKGDNGNMKI